MKRDSAMFYFAVLIGSYSYLIFILGILGWLYPWVIGVVTLGFVGGVSIGGIRKISGMSKIDPSTYLRGNGMVLLFALLIALQGFVNLIGVLGSEIGFDALWYHLTLPKLYLINHAITFIPGGLLYYSAMPKLAEMLYTVGLALGNENLVRFIHYAFGLLTCLATYKLSRKFFNSRISLIAVVIFYSNLVVGWESTSAYIDLVRAFFEVMALWGFLNWYEIKTSPHPSPKRRGRFMFVMSAVMVGLAITTKVLAIGSLLIFSVLVILFEHVENKTSRLASARSKNKIVKLFIRLFVYWVIALAVPLPWFVFSYLRTGNPVYPFFSAIYKITPEPFSFIGFFRETWILFTHASDPVSLVYMIFLPVILWLFYKSGMTKLRIVGIYSLLAIVIWYFTPRTGGGRFILPYLPALSILCAACINQFWKDMYLRRLLLVIVILASLFSIVYRAAANSKYIPVIVGKETKQEFLTNHLTFGFGDFYDTDGYFKEHIKPSDKVLLYGFHNLYYVDFPFVDSSWVRDTDKFTYIAVQKGELPENYRGWKLVYENKKTMVKLYRKD